jgi:protein-disulfide isomerase
MRVSLFRLLLLTVAALAALAALPARAADPLTPAQKEAVERVIHDYLLEHPEVMVEALRNAEVKLKEKKEENAKQAIVQRRSELLSDATAPIAGNPQGDVTIVEFFDYRCPYCKQVEPHLEALLKEDPKLRIVYKEFPVLGPESVYAARMALAARKQGKYAAFHEAMMAAKGKITEETILMVAHSVGIDVARAKTDMTAPDIQEIIKRNYALADALDIQGTPAFIVGDTLVPGATDLDNLRRLIAEARKSSG